MSVGLPDWDALLAPLRAAARVPREVTDAPLVAEYIQSELGRPALDAHILREMISTPSPTRAHLSLVKLGLQRIWTTNYDLILESVFGPDAFVLVGPDDYKKRAYRPVKTVIGKLHGSIGLDKNLVPGWERRPVITRGDYERFAGEQPLLWADVTAQFLTTSFLFMGFSFEDPNIEVLLRLSRSLPKDFHRLNHYAIVRTPVDAVSARLAELRWDDLERAGINVVEIASFDQIPEILDELHRRLLPPALFVAGSRLTPRLERVVVAAGHLLARSGRTLHLESLTSPAAISFGRGVVEGMREMGEYQADLLRFHFRRNDELDVPRLHERMGTIIFEDEADKQVIRRRVLQASTAFLAIGGGPGTLAETELAVEVNLPRLVMSGGRNEEPFRIEAYSLVSNERLAAMAASFASSYDHGEDDAVLAERLAELIVHVLSLEADG
jgi:hypothetical protein